MNLFSMSRQLDHLICSSSCQIGDGALGTSFYLIVKTASWTFSVAVIT